MAEPVLIRTSERTNFKRCRWSWWNSYVERIRPKYSSPPLRFGTLVHKALEVRYPVGKKRGPLPSKSFEHFYKEELKELAPFNIRDEDGEWADALELGISMMRGYIEKFGKDDEYEVIASEQPFQVPVYDPETKKLLFTYVGTLDGIWRNRMNGKIRMVDYKTAASISVTHLPLDEQAGSYFAYAPDWMRKMGILQADQMPSEILYTFLRKAKPDLRPKNKLGQSLNQDGTVSKVQPVPLFHREVVYRDPADIKNLRERVMQEAREMRLARAGKLAHYKNPGPFTCMGCGYKDMCELHEAGADWETYRDATMVGWDPYDAHEIESERT